MYIIIAKGMNLFGRYCNIVANDTDAGSRLLDL